MKTHEKAISEVFKEASQIRTKQGRIDYLRANQSPLMQYMIQGAYHPAVIWLLPRGIPPFRQNRMTIEAPAILHAKIRELEKFCKGGGQDMIYDRIDETKRKNMRSEE